jgi:hypothetical protein
LAACNQYTEGEAPKPDTLPEVSYSFCFDERETINVDADAAGMRDTVAPVALWHLRDQRVSIQGTAFCVFSSAVSGEALFVTARHVIQDLDPYEPDIQPLLLLTPTRIDPSGPYVPHGVPIHQVVTAPTSCDVALLVVDVNSEVATSGLGIKSLRVGFGEPVVGMNTMALGYPQMSGHFNYNMVASRGRIDEVFPRRRDRVLSTFPSFRTTGWYPHGMSGGPIIDASGHVTGIVSLGMDSSEVVSGEVGSLRTDSGEVVSGMIVSMQTDSGETPIGTGAHIGSILELRPELHTADGVLRELSIPELLNAGAIRRNDADVTLTRDNDGVELRWQ